MANSRALLSALAVGLWLSALNVQYRDIQQVVPFLIQVWMYASPIVYPIETIPAGIWRWLYGLNPMDPGFSLGAAGRQSTGPDSGDLRDDGPDFVGEWFVLFPANGKNLRRYCVGIYVRLRD